MPQCINAEVTVAQKPNRAIPQKGLYIFLGWLFLLLLSGAEGFHKKRKEKNCTKLNKLL